jgi:hypothetical protein
MEALVALRTINCALRIEAQLAIAKRQYEESKPIR